MSDLGRVIIESAMMQVGRVSPSRPDYEPLGNKDWQLRQHVAKTSLPYVMHKHGDLWVPKNRHYLPLGQVKHMTSRGNAVQTWSEMEVECDEYAAAFGFTEGELTLDQPLFGNLSRSDGYLYLMRDGEVSPFYPSTMAPYLSNLLRLFFNIEMRYNHSPYPTKAA